MPQAARKINRAPEQRAAARGGALDFRNVRRRRRLITTKLKFGGEIE
jgi:hypothetical protein